MIKIVLEWIIWNGSMVVGIWFATGIRQAAVARRSRRPTWKKLILSLALVTLPIAFLFLPYSKLYIVWILLVIYPLSMIVSSWYIPVVSQLFIWPAYFYARILMKGTGRTLYSPSVKSPWASRKQSASLRPQQGKEEVPKEVQETT